MATEDSTLGHVEQTMQPSARKMSISDVRDALRSGIADFNAHPSHLFFVYVMYPVIALFMARAAFGKDIIPLLFPLSGGIALIGPAVAVVFYEISRRRERGLDTSWRHAFAVLRSTVMFSVAAVACLLLAIFIMWLFTAQWIYILNFGGEDQTSILEFTRQVFVTKEGWQLIIVGCGAGFLFALVALAVGVVSFPLLLDHDIGPRAAITASILVSLKNPYPVAAWGFVVASTLFLGSLPAFVGLAVVFPVLGHATWHFYRKAVVWHKVTDS